MNQLAAPAVALYEERLGVRRGDWRWLPVIVLIMYLVVAPQIGHGSEWRVIFTDTLMPIAAAAWVVNVLRYRKARVRVDADYLWVGKRWVRLCALELSTLSQAGNTWPWRVFNKRYLGANPVWTRDSVALRGIDAGKRYWVAVGTNDRDALVAVLTRAIPEARARAEAAGTWSPTVVSLPRPGWHPDPWDPTGQLRWWDGAQWSGWTSPPNAPLSGPAPDVGPPPADEPGRP